MITQRLRGSSEDSPEAVWKELKKTERQETAGSHLSSGVARVDLHPQLLGLLPQPAHKVPQPHDVVAVVDHGQTWTQTHSEAAALKLQFVNHSTSVSQILLWVILISMNQPHYCHI